MDLSQVFDQGQFSLIKPGMDAFNLEQQKQQAGLAGLLGQEQRAKAMHPFEIDSKKAYTRQANAQAGTMEDRLKVLQGIPLDQRIAVGVAENKSKLTGEALKQADSEMEQLATLAAAALKNGGSLPLGMNVQNPEHAKYFGSPKGAQLAAQIAKAYWLAKPKELFAAENDRRDTERAIELARIMAQSRVDSAVASGNKPPADPKTFDAAIVQRMKLLAIEKDPTKQQQLRDEIQYFETAKLRAIQAKAEAAQTGKPNLGAMEIPTNPAPSLAPTPIPGPGAQPTATPQQDPAKHLEFLRTNPKAIQIREAFKAGKISKEQAQQQLMELK